MEIQLVTFRIGTEQYGVNILSVREIIKLTTITKLPNAEDCVEGVIDLRGKVISIFDGRKKFNLPAEDANNQTRIMIFDFESRISGLIVDSVQEVLRLSDDLIEQSPVATENEYVTGVARLPDNIIILLDVSKMI